MKNRLEIIVIMILFLIFLFYFKKKKLIKALILPVREKPTIKIGIVPNPENPVFVKTETEALYTKSEKTCSDSYINCGKWAEAGECEINPEYMLFACPGACKACHLSPVEKQEIVAKAAKLPLPGCVYHGEAYPGYVMPDYKNL